MRNPVHLLVWSAMSGARASIVLVAVPSGLLFCGAGAAMAAGTTVRAESTNVTFGLLGPVGLVAVALGIVGMTVGVLRQHRKARTTVVPVEPAIADAVLFEEPTRPMLSPIRRP